MVCAAERARCSVSSSERPISVKDACRLSRRLPATFCERSSASLSVVSTTPTTLRMALSISSERLTRPTDRLRSASWRSSSVPTRLDCAALSSSDAWLSTFECSSKRPTIPATCASVWPEIFDRRSIFPSSRRLELDTMSAACEADSEKRVAEAFNASSAAPKPCAARSTAELKLVADCSTISAMLLWVCDSISVLWRVAATSLLAASLPARAYLSMPCSTASAIAVWVSDSISVLWRVAATSLPAASVPAAA
ncbi:hypothetical protein D3C78_951770 [compost metagenome]